MLRVLLPSAQSGCLRNNSESGLNISPSNQSPNSIPFESAYSEIGAKPLGQTSLLTNQSPNPDLSFLREPNQPSSNTIRSIPI